MLSLPETDYGPEQEKALDRLLIQRDFFCREIREFSEAMMNELLERNIPVVQWTISDMNFIEVSFRVTGDPDSLSIKDNRIEISPENISFSGYALEMKFGHGTRNHNKENIAKRVKTVIDFGEAIGFLSRAEDKLDTGVVQGQHIDWLNHFDLVASYSEQDIRGHFWATNDFVTRITNYLAKSFNRDFTVTMTDVFTLCYTIAPKENAHWNLIIETDRFNARVSEVYIQTGLDAEKNDPHRVKHFSAHVFMAHFPLNVDGEEDWGTMEDYQEDMEVIMESIKPFFDNSLLS